MSRFLIVEDETSIGSMIADILRFEGLDCTVVTDGRSGLRLLHEQPFDAVVLDVMLPGMDGISVLRAIRDDPALETIPVVMLTAKADDDSTWAGWKAGCNYYLPKPFDPDELVAVIKRLRTSGVDAR